MLLGKRKMHFSIFAKMLAMFLFVTLPLYLFSIQVNIIGQNETRKELAEAAKSRINFYLSSFEKDISNIITQETNLIKDPDVRDLSRNPSDNYDFNIALAANRVRERLKSLQESSAYIEESAVFLPLYSKKITGKIIGDLDQEEYKAIKKLRKNNVYPFAFYNDRYYISISSDNFEPDKDTDPSFIISVRLSKAALNKTLENFTKEGNGGAFLISGKYGLNILSPSDASIFNYLRKLSQKSDFLKDWQNAGVNNIKADGKKYILSFKYSHLLDTALVIFYSEESFLSSLGRYNLWLWLMSAITIFVIAASSIWTRRIIVQPLEKLIKAFKKVEKGELNIAVAYNKDDEYGYLYKRFNDMFERLNKLIEQEYEQRIRLRNSELKQLQYQINPHFLYNSLFILYSLIKTYDYDCALNMSQHLSSYYQYLTRSASDEVPLEKEVAHARNYVQIQTIRFSNRVNIDFGEIPEGFSDFIVPRLIIQPLIENAFKYGLRDKLSDARLIIGINVIDGFLTITIEDNGEEISEDGIAGITAVLNSGDNSLENTGMVNVHRRLKIKFGSDSGLYISKSGIGGFKVEIRIALKEEPVNV